MYRIYRKPDPFKGDFDFVGKTGIFDFRSFLCLISWSLPDDEGGITCMCIIIYPCCQQTLFQSFLGITLGNTES